MAEKYFHIQLLGDQAGPVIIVILRNSAGSFALTKYAVEVRECGGHAADSHTRQLTAVICRLAYTV